MVGGLLCLHAHKNDAKPDSIKISLADLIVLAGCSGVEKAMKNANEKIIEDYISA